jgi:NAD(P)-dependent dehydrogenase (short-subunit alcohol dehydrogenase family)
VGILEGKTMVIAGVGPGLGRKLAVAATREGASVVLGARRADPLAALARELEEAGGQVVAVSADIGDPEGCSRLVGGVDRLGGQLDALVVVAALDAIFGGIEGADLGHWRAAMELNFFAPMQLTAAALDRFGPEGGAICFVTTQTIYRPATAVLQAGYAGSKAAVLGAARHLAVELGPRGIRVNTVAPGWMDGPAVQHYVAAVAAGEGVEEAVVRRRITDNLPLRDMAADGDVAETICFLCSDRARRITGQALLVNAGEHMH